MAKHESLAFFTHMHKGEVFKLRSGAKLVYVSLPHMPVACASVWFRAGARFDPKGKEGLAHFFEHLLTVRTKKYQSKSERFTALAEKGIEDNARTTFETACYYQFNTNKTLLDSVGFLLDGISQSIIDDEDVENEKNAILDEESRNHSDPSQYLWRLSQTGLWPESLLGRGFFGNKKSISSIKRKDLSNFFNRYYRPNNAVFTIIGNREQEENVLTLLDSFSWGKNESVEFPREVFLPPKKVVVERRKDDAQIWVNVGWRIVPESVGMETVTAEAVRGLFTSGWISLLINRLRVRENITYWVNGDFADFGDTGYMQFSFSVEKGFIDQGIRAVLEEVQKVKDGKMTDEEFSKIRFSFVSNLSRTYLDIYELMLLYGHPAIIDRPILSVDEHMKALNGLQKEDAEAFVRKHMRKENISVALIGDIKKSDERKVLEIIEKF